LQPPNGVKKQRKDDDTIKFLKTKDHKHPEIKAQNISIGSNTSQQLTTLGDPTGLFDFTAKRICDAPSDLFNNLKSALVTTTKQTDVSTEYSIVQFNQLFPDLDLSKDIDPKTARIFQNENYSDVLIVTFGSESKTGLIIAENSGIWSISGFLYSWSRIQDLDIIMSFRDDGSIKLDTLK
jgi:hypothetical protein